LSLVLAGAALSQQSDPVARTPDRVISIAAERFAFSPSRVVVKQGDLVELVVSSDDTDHGFRVPAAGIDAAIPQQGKGEVRVRFIAGDEGSGSVVEAAIDEFEVFRVDCDAICQTNLGFGGPGTASLSMCGGDLSTGTSATIALTGATPGGTAILFAGLTFAPTPAKGGVLVPVPPTLKYIVPLNGTGGFSDEVSGGFGPVSIYVQAVYTAPLLPAPHWGFSNAIRVDLQP